MVPCCWSLLLLVGLSLLTPSVPGFGSDGASPALWLLAAPVWGCWESSAMNVLSSGAAVHVPSEAASEDIWVLDTAGWDAPVLGPRPPSSLVHVCPYLAAKAASPPTQNSGTSSPDPFESQPLTVASSKPSSARKTPESFLGPNAALVNLDSLVTRPAPPAQALNPFLAPGMWLPGFPQPSTLFESGPGAGLWALTYPPALDGLFPQAVGRWGAHPGAPASWRSTALRGVSRPPHGVERAEEAAEAPCLAGWSLFLYLLNLQAQ